MKTYFAAFLLCLLSVSTRSYSQIKLKDILNKKSSSGITENEAGQGIK
jgi:hypothetical protein